MRPFKAGTWPLILEDGFFDQVADVPNDVRCAAPTLLDNAAHAHLYRRRLTWLTADGARFLTRRELALAGEMKSALDIPTIEEDPKHDDDES